LGTPAGPLYVTPIVLVELALIQPLDLGVSDVITPIVARVHY